MENEKYKNSIDSNSKNFCNICQINNGEIICQDCSPAHIFCQKCNESIHQLPSKQNHNQKINIQNENIDFNGNNKNSQEISSQRFNNKNNNSNLESTFSQTFRTFKYEPLSYCTSQESIINNNTINNNYINKTSRIKNPLNSSDYIDIENREKNLTYYNYNTNDYNILFENNKKQNNTYKNPVVNNYIEQMRRIYEAEQKNIRLQQYQLQKKLTRTNEENEREINYLNNEINNIKTQNENDIKNVIKENEFEQKNILEKKDKEINALSNRNFELETANNDLIEKINNISNIINNDKINNKEKILNYQNEINNISQNNNDLKNYYEKKVDYLERIFSEEKNKLIAAYEAHIDKINLGNMKSKKEYINQAQNKDNKLRNIINDYNSESDKLNIEINNLNEEILRLKNEEQELIKKNIEIKNNNDILKENYENAKRDIQYQIKQKHIFEQNLANTQRHFYKIKAENEKLNRLTYGTFERSKSRGK